eukprot:543430_1
MDNVEQSLIHIKSGMKQIILNYAGNFQNFLDNTALFRAILNCNELGSDVGCRMFCKLERDQLDTYYWDLSNVWKIDLRKFVAFKSLTLCCYAEIVSKKEIHKLSDVKYEWKIDSKILNEITLWAQ